MKNKKQKSIQANAAPIAIVGMGCLFPKADSVGAYWANIKEGVDAITETPETHWRPEDYFHSDPAAPDMTYARRGGFLDVIDFEPLKYGISPNNIEATDTTQLLGMVVAEQALRDAGYAVFSNDDGGKPFNRDRTSVLLGVTGTLELVIPLGARLGHPLWRKALKDAGIDNETADDVVKRIAEGYVPWQENSFPGLLGNVAAGRIANRFDLGGTNCVVDAACASSFGAIHLAAMELAAGRADMVVTGGLDTFNDIFMYMCFSKTPALSPTGNSRPFSADADGTILGEGLGLLVLKRLEDAKRDSDKIHAVILGMGSSSDGLGKAIYAPSSSGQAKALRSAYDQAGITPDTIELIEAHGTGTKVGDAVELEALTEVFGAGTPGEPWCAVGSVKSMLGHTKAGAGVAGLIKAALSLKNKVLPPTIKVERPAPSIDSGNSPFYVNTVKRPWLPRKAHPRRAAVSAFGFGGSNFHCVLEEAETKKESPDWDGNVAVLPFSGASKEDLWRDLEPIKDDASWNDLLSLSPNLCKTFNKDAEHRLVLVLERNGSEIAKALSSTKKMLDQNSAKTWTTPDGAFYGSGPCAGKVAVLFPGQGSQRVGMLRDLACQFPEILNEMTAANLAFGKDAPGDRLSDRIYPHPVFNEEDAKEQEKILAETSVAQPAIGALSLGAFKTLQKLGVEAHATAGHSFGELTALCAAGTINEADFHKLANLRGKLMAEAASQNAKQSGGMLAVAMDADELRELISSENMDLVVANHNAPTQAVLSGEIEQLEKASIILKSKNIRNKRLPVSAAFHSSFVAAAAAPFAEALKKIKFSAPKVPVFANASGGVYPKDADSARDLLASQIPSPVEFVKQINNMYELGVRTFVEVGANRILTGLVSAILGDRRHAALCLDSSNGKRRGQLDLARLLAQLAVDGRSVDLLNWNKNCQAVDDAIAKVEKNKKSTLTIPICGANYVKPRPKTPPREKPIRKEEPALMDSEKTIAAPANATEVKPLAANAQALAAAQQSILILQQMQQQTAELHRKFLEGQEEAQRTIQQLISGQQTALGLSPRAAEFNPIQTPTAEPLSLTPRFEAPPAPLQAPMVETIADRTAPSTPTTDAKASNSAKVDSIVLEVIADKTGYPTDMLSLDMTLDADLGIDSIKRVEILSALQERLPDAPPVSPDDMAKIRTVGQIAEYIGTNDAGTPAETIHRIKGPDISAIVLEVIADKTGYPTDMLSLDMTLDADLGIDSIKRVEILSALQERLPDAPPVSPDDMAKIRTVGQIAEYIGTNDAGTPAETIHRTKGPDISAIVLEVIADKTGYPTNMLSLDMTLDADLGIDSIKRVEILSALQERLPDAPPVSPDDMAKIRTVGQIAEYIQPSSKDAPALEVPVKTEPIEQTLSASDQKASVDRRLLVSEALNGKPREDLHLCQNGVVWVTDDGSGLAKLVCKAFSERGIKAETVAMDAEPNGQTVSGLVIISPENCGDEFIMDAFSLIRRAAPSLNHAGKNGGAVLIGACRMDGEFGFSNGTLKNPITGGLAGIVKTAGWEWPEVACKVLDLSPDFTSKALLSAEIVEEALIKGPTEVGLSPRHRTMLRLNSKPLNGSTGGKPLSAGNVVVATGGARGVTAEVMAAMAAAHKSVFILLGRSEPPEPEPQWLQALSDEKVIKRELVNRYKKQNKRATPKEIEAACRKISSGREISSNIKRIQDAGGQVVYKSVDVRNQEDVGAAVAEARIAYGPVRGIVHGAGVLADRLIEDQTDEQFALVYKTKVEGLRSLLRATEGDDLETMVFFSSSTGRFGRKGQAAYAAANEVLNKMAQEQTRKRPDCRVVSVNWGPWDGGMVTPEIKKVFEAEGIPVIPLKAGADYLVREIAGPNKGAVEVVVTGVSEVAAQTPTKGDSPTPSSMVSAFERELEIKSHPFLTSHVMNGKAVLPMAMMIEWMAHGAMHENPGLQFSGFDNLKIYKGVKMSSSETLQISVRANKPLYMEGLEIVPVELVNGKILHATAEIVLTSTPPKKASPSGDVSPIISRPRESSEIYASGELFHGQMLRGIKRVLGCSEKGIHGLAKTAPSPSEWMNSPMRSSWLTDPLILDSAFQLMILWTFDQCGAGSLPTGTASYRQFNRKFPGDNCEIIIKATQQGPHKAIAAMEFLDASKNLVARIDGYECVVDSKLKEAFSRNALVAE